MNRPEKVSPKLNLRPVILGAVAIASSFLANSSPVSAQGWPSYGHDQQHTCLAVAGSQIPQKIRWSTKVDLSPPSGTIYIHYGSPVITRSNTVIVPVKNGSSYEVTAINASTGPNATTGAGIWTATSDYSLPSHDWVPIFGITLTPKDKTLVYPGAGGTIYARTFPDTASGTTSQYAFFNTPSTNYYAMNPAAFSAAIQICTPVSTDALGNVFFGYVSSGAALPGYPNGIPSGLARVSSTGVGSFVSAPVISGDSTMQKVAYNCAPSFSADESTVYVAVNGPGDKGYLCALNSTTLAYKSSVLLLDPSTPANNPSPAVVDDDGSPTPTVGPDGDVYYGVLSTNISNNDYRGFLLHFDSTLKTQKISGAFGWDDTPSIVPASLVPSYTGTSSYLLLTKYNNYADGGGSGINQVAVLDPNASAVDPTSGITAMKPVIAVNGVTKDASFPNNPNAVREWCINSAAIDPINQCAVINSEDGHVYRWSFITNSLSPGLYLAPATSEAYTPTVIGPDGAVYAINDAVLYSCISSPTSLVPRVSPIPPGGGPIINNKP